MYFRKRRSSVNFGAAGVPVTTSELTSCFATGTASAPVVKLKFYVNYSEGEAPWLTSDIRLGWVRDAFGEEGEASDQQQPEHQWG
jgi:hypothetical protein